MLKRLCSFETAALISVVAAVAAAAQAAAQDVPKVKLYSSAAIVEIDQAPLFLGGPLGFYAEQGVDVEFGSAAGSAATLQLLASGQVEMGHIGMDVLTLAKATNPDLPVTAVYLHYRKNIYEIVVPLDSDIRTVPDLDQKNIGVANLASGAIPSLRATLIDAGLNPNASVGLIPVGIGPQALAALKSGRVDALALFRAQHAAIEATGTKFRYFTRDAPSTVIAVNDKFLKDHPETVAKVLRGIVAGTIFAQVNPEATVREHWGLFGRPQGLSEEEAMQRSLHVLARSAELWRAVDEDTMRWGEINAGHWDQLQAFLVSQKLLDTPVPTGSLFTTTVLDPANDIDVGAIVARAQTKP